MRKRSSFVLFVILIFATSTFCWDSDKDGIPNKYDECKKQKEDFDNYEDTDGCPDLDNDQDKIPDTNDKCPDNSEDFDGFEDTDGCPDLDNDKDGILDKMDKCPNKKEDFDSYQDMDGCPDNDNDNDGVVDKFDKCPVTSEDMDGFEDTDGCPDLDNDKDGIKDISDKCPNQAETYNNKDDEDGCPDSDLLPIDETKLYPDVKFRIGTDELTFESFRSLDSLGRQLSEYKDKKVKILIYLNFSADEQASLSLLARQHQSIINHLISKGASSDQFAPADFSLEYYEQTKDTHLNFNQTRSIEIKLWDPSFDSTPADTLKPENISDTLSE